MEGIRLPFTITSRCGCDFVWEQKLQVFENWRVLTGKKKWKQTSEHSIMWNFIIHTYNGYQVFIGVKAAGAWRWPPTPNLAPRLKKEYSHTSTPPLSLRSLLYGEIYFYHNLYYSRKTTTTIKSEQISGAGHVECARDRRNTHRIFCKKPEG
jgi:hypothetical protein